MEQRLDIQRMSAADWQRVRALRLAGLAAEPDAFGSTLERETAFEPTDWQRRLAGSAATFLAVLAGADVGIVTGAPWVGEERGDPAPRVAGLFGLWVARDARGRGIGDRLVDEVVTWARSEGYARLVLEVGDQNAPATRLYERHGFLPTGCGRTLPPPRAHVRERELALDL